MQLKAEEEAENISNLEHEPNKDKLRHWKVYKPRARKNEKPREKKTSKKTEEKEVEKREWKGVGGGGQLTILALPIIDGLGWCFNVAN